MPGLVNKLPTLDFVLLYQPIEDLPEAKAYIDMLARNGLMYHFDDGPEEIIWSMPADECPTAEDVIEMRKRQDEVYYYWTNADDCPIGYALICLRKHGLLEGETT